MKRIFMFFAALSICGVMMAQNVFTVCYAISDDGFVNVRQYPSMKGKVLTKLWQFSHGLGTGVVRGKQGNWTKVSVFKDNGWVYTKYIDTMTWYDGTGATMLVADKPRVTIYLENFADEEMGLPFFSWVEKGTIIADRYTTEGEYYVLETAHDHLYVKKTDVKVVKK